MGENNSAGSGSASPECSAAVGNPPQPHSPSEAAPPPQYSAEYLAQLLKDKKQLTAFPNVFLHMERLVDEGNPLIT